MQASAAVRPGCAIAATAGGARANGPASGGFTPPAAARAPGRAPRLGRTLRGGHAEQLRVSRARLRGAARRLPESAWRGGGGVYYTPSARWQTAAGEIVRDKGNSAILQIAASRASGAQGGPTEQCVRVRGPGRERRPSRGGARPARARCVTGRQARAPARSGPAERRAASCRPIGACRSQAARGAAGRAALSETCFSAGGGKAGSFLGRLGAELAPAAWARPRPRGRGAQGLHRCRVLLHLCSPWARTRSGLGCCQTCLAGALADRP